MKDDRLYLSNIAECIERIESYTSSGKEAFMQTRMIQDAVMRNFEVIGEATKRLSPELREAHPDIQWQLPSWISRCFDSRLFEGEFESGLGHYRAEFTKP